MKASLLDKKGKETKKIELKKEIFEVDVNDFAISQYVYSFLSNQRQSTAHTKDRSEVRGGGRKPHRQKGTGRARAGSSRSPLWTKGGITFGPTKFRNWKKKLNKSFKRNVLKSALTQKAKDGEVIVAKDLGLSDSKGITKSAQSFVSALKVDTKVTIIISKYDDLAIKAFKNIDKVIVTNINELNAYDILNGGKIVFTEESLKDLYTKLIKTENDNS